MPLRPRPLHGLLAAGLAAAALAASGASAQCEPSAGFFLGAPLSVSVADGTLAGVDGAATRFKPHGFLTAADIPAPWPNNPGDPSLRLEDILAATLCSGLGAPLPDVDALSLGEDFVLADANGRLAMPPRRWGVVTVSVSPDSRGRRGSAIASAASATGGPGGDLFTYVLPGSALPAELVGVTDRSLARDELGMLGANRPGFVGDVDAIDLFTPAHTQVPVVRQDLLTPIEIYFSVSSATLSRVPATWWGGSLPSGATVLFVRQSAANGSFTCPRVWRRYDELGLRQTDDLDALAYDKRQCKLLFSTKSRVRNQILYLDVCADGPIGPVPYTDTDGVPIADKIGLLETDDVDAICTLDPSVFRAGGRVRNVTFYTMGSPLDRTVRFPGRVDAAAFRHRTPRGGDAFTTWLTGWTPSGPVPGIGVLFASVPPGGAPFVVDVVRRDPAQLGCRGVTSYLLPIPPGLTAFASTLDLTWVAATADLSEGTDAWPIRIHF